MDPVIEVHDLTKRYKDTLALDGVSFRVERNAIYGFLGRNGAGKTDCDVDPHRPELRHVRHGPRLRRGPVRERPGC